MDGQHPVTLVAIIFLLSSVMLLIVKAWYHYRLRSALNVLDAYFNNHLNTWVSFETLRKRTQHDRRIIRDALVKMHEERKIKMRIPEEVKHTYFGNNNVRTSELSGIMLHVMEHADYCME